MGLRGLRVSLAYPGAISDPVALRAYGQLAIMFPMVATVNELRTPRMVDQNRLTRRPSARMMRSGR
ncbi:putative PEP-binding protein [Limosilactobacillus fermentum]